MVAGPPTALHLRDYDVTQVRANTGHFPGVWHLTNAVTLSRLHFSGPYKLSGGRFCMCDQCEVIIEQWECKAFMV